MRSLVTVSLMWALALVVAAPVSAGVLFDGSGNPVSAGFVYDPAGSEYSGFTFDDPFPGVMHENTGPSQFARWDLAPTTAASELDRSAGWAVQTRFNTVTNAGSYDFGLYMSVLDGSGGFGLLPRPHVVDVYTGDFASYTGVGTNPDASINILPGVYHKYRLVVAPGATTGDVYVDFATTPNATIPLNFTPAPTPRLRFGDVSSTDYGDAYWDYLAVNRGGPTTGRTPTGLVFADNFNDSSTAGDGDLTGQAADTGQTWASFALGGWTVPYTMYVGTGYGSGGTQGAGVGTSTGNHGNSVALGTTLSGGPIRLEMDLRNDSSSGSGGPQFWLRDSVSGKSASLIWHTGLIWLEGRDLPIQQQSAGLTSGILHVILDVDLENKLVEYSWYDFNDPNDATHSGTVILGPYTAAFAPDQLHIWKNSGSSYIGYDNIALYQIPEPGSLTLLALGLGLLALCGWRRR